MPQGPTSAVHPLDAVSRVAVPVRSRRPLFILFYFFLLSGMKNPKPQTTCNTTTLLQLLVYVLRKTSIT